MFAFGKKLMDGGQQAWSKYPQVTDLGMSQMQGQDMSTTPTGLMDAAEFTNAPKEDAMFTGEGLMLGGAQDQPEFGAANEEADGMFGWLQKKYPEMADMGTAESLAFLKQKGVIGSGKYHGMGQANQLGQSQAQGANMMTGMDSLMQQAMGGSVPQQKQIQLGLMGGGSGGNPWGLMGG